MTHRQWVIMRICMGVSGICTGISVCLAFGLHFHSYHGALWGGISGVFAAFALIVSILEFRGFWTKDNLKCLFGVFVFGIVTSVIALAGFVGYTVMAIVNGEGIVVYGNSLWMGSVWTSMTAKWTGMLTSSSWSYYKRIRDAGKDSEKEAKEKEPMMESSGEKA